MTDSQKLQIESVLDYLRSIMPEINDYEQSYVELIIEDDGSGRIATYKGKSNTMPDEYSVVCSFKEWSIIENEVTE